ncbi:MAG TPA: YceI family protein [Acidimicrobiales bacterium]|nr:YceI family protein [Acidimicrobiales bacterium]
MSDTQAPAIPHALPLATGEWTLDAAHSGVHFKVRHLGLTNIRGRFNEFAAALVVGDTLDDVSVTATIDMASVDTNQADRDNHLLSTDFFRADLHPTMEFRSTRVTGGGDEYELHGELTVNGVTRPVTIPVEFTGLQVYPMDGSTHAGFTGEAQLSRSDYEVDFNVPLGVDKLAIGDKVKVELDLQFREPAVGSDQPA